MVFQFHRKDRLWPAKKRFLAAEAVFWAVRFFHQIADAASSSNHPLNRGCHDICRPQRQISKKYAVGYHDSERPDFEDRKRKETGT